MKRLINLALELERAIQEEAFSRISKNADYQEGQRLLNAAKLANNLAKTLTLSNDNTVGQDKSDIIANKKLESISKRQPKQNGYPIFFAENNILVKIGKGKSKKSKPYRHSVSKNNIQTVIDSLESISSKQEQFTLPDIVNEVGGNCPIYQIYITVEAMRHLGYFNQSTRGLYSLQSDYELPQDAGKFLEIVANGSLTKGMED